nr:MAG TPA: Spermatid maturation protein 1 [Bacteriophage sp.]
MFLCSYLLGCIVILLTFIMLLNIFINKVI